jgi:hypothetical protein
LNGVAIGITGGFPAALISIFETRKIRQRKVNMGTSREFDVAARGPMTAGRPDRPFGCDSSRIEGTIILGFG